MLSNVITYLIIGVLFNLVFDQLVSISGNEEYRFTMRERLIMVGIWPLGVILFIVYLVRNINN